MVGGSLYSHNRWWWWGLSMREDRNQDGPKSGRTWYRKDRYWLERFSDAGSTHGVVFRWIEKRKELSRSLKVKENLGKNQLEEWIRLKNSHFYLNTSTINHWKTSIHDIRSLVTADTLKITNENLVIIKNIGSVTFELHISSRKIFNTIIDVEYVSDIICNAISTELVMIIIDQDDHEALWLYI